MFKVNEYFNGQVKSLGFNTAQGPATVGVMAKGEYEFGTSSKEVMTMISGHVSVKLPGSATWQPVHAGASFTVAAKQKFQIRVDEDSSYLCLYQ